MRVLDLQSGFEDYWRLPGWVIQHGSYRSPRGRGTYDVGPTTLVFHDITKMLPVGCGRGVSPRVGAVEALQLIGAKSRPDLTVWASPNFRAYQEDDGSFHGAYGERIGRQLWYAYDKLLTDPDTRQAVVTLWKSERDNLPGMKDYPCTVALNFSLIEDRLELRVLMRSNDVWLGLPYDIFQFTQVQLTLASALRVLPGPYTHTAWSLHIYAEHINSVGALHEPHDALAVTQPLGIGHLGHDVSRAVIRAQQLMEQKQPHQITLSEEWYRDRLASFTGNVG